MADSEEQRGYFYSCISEHLQAVIPRSTPTGAAIFREEGQQDESCFDKLAREFHKKYPLSTRRYELFMMRQPKGKTMSFYINTLLPRTLLTSTSSPRTCTDNALKQELI